MICVSVAESWAAAQKNGKDQRYLFECARRAWGVNKERAERADYVLAIDADKKAVAAFKPIGPWFECPDEPGRYMFYADPNGEPEILKRYGQVTIDCGQLGFCYVNNPV